MNNTLLVQVAHARHELGEQSACRIVLQIAVIEDVVEELTARCVLENDTNVSLCLHHFVQPNDVGVRDASQNGNFAVDLGQSGGVVANAVSLDQLDSDLDP